MRTVFYRDMKSANILVKNENGDCAIGDLGSAIILDSSLHSKELAKACTGQVTILSNTHTHTHTHTRVSCGGWEPWDFPSLDSGYTLYVCPALTSYHNDISS